MTKLSEFSLGLLGYNRGQVDNIIQQNQKEIQALQDKIKSLETELAQFREVEEALKDSLVDARVKGNEIIQDSHHQAEVILNNTNEQVNQYKEEVSQQGNVLMQSGRELRDELKVMKDNMRSLIQTFNQLLDDTDLDGIFPNEADQKMALSLNSLEDIEAITTHQANEAITDNSLSDEEKENLQKLIQEVISNEATKQVEGQQDHKMVDLRVVKNY